MVGALKSAEKRLEKSMEALEGKDEEELLYSLRLVTSDLEYTLFLLSLKVPNGFESTRKFGAPSKHAGAGTVLALAQNLVKEALASAGLGDLLETRKKVSEARDSLVRLQAVLERKQKEN